MNDHFEPSTLRCRTTGRALSDRAGSGRSAAAAGGEGCSRSGGWRTVIITSRDAPGWSAICTKLLLWTLAPSVVARYTNAAAPSTLTAYWREACSEDGRPAETAEPPMFASSSRTAVAIISTQSTTEQLFRRNTRAGQLTREPYDYIGLPGDDDPSLARARGVATWTRWRARGRRRGGAEPG